MYISSLYFKSRRVPGIRPHDKMMLVKSKIILNLRKYALYSNDDNNQ